MRQLCFVVLLISVMSLPPGDVIGGDVTAGDGTAKEERTQSATQAEIEKLLQQLNSVRRAERIQAEAKLMKVGPAVLEHLPPPELLDGISLKEAVRRIRIRLEQQKARESVLASRITLGKTLTVAELLTEIRQQSGNQILSNKLPEKLLQQSLTVNFQRTPFWDVISELCEQLPIETAPAANQSALTLLPLTDDAPQKPEGKFPKQRIEAFQVKFVSAVVRPSFIDGVENILRVVLELRAEPRLRPLFLTYSGRDLSLSVSGVLLPPLTPDARPELALGQNGQQIRVQVDFPLSTDQKVEEFSLSGLLTLQVAAGVEAIEFPTLEKAGQVMRRRGGVSVRMLDVKLTENQQEARVHVEVSYDQGGPAFETHRTWIFHNDVYLKNSAGKRIPLNGNYETTLQTDGGVGVRYRFLNLQEKPASHQFVYVAPTLIINVPLKFNFPKLLLK